MHTFDVERAARRILELSENLLEWFAEHVCHDVQAPAMRHADERLPQPGLRRFSHDLVENRHEHVEAFDREARLARERPVQELLERLDLCQPIEQRDRVDRIEGRPETAGLDGVPEPVTLVRQENVGEIVPGGRTVELPQPIDDFGHRRRAFGDRPRDERGRQRPQIVLGHAVGGRLQRRIAQGPAAQRIDLRGEMAIPPDRLCEIEGADGLAQNLVIGPAPAVAPGRTRGLAFAFRRAWLAEACRRRRRRPTVEELARRGIDRMRIALVPLVQLQHVGRVDALEIFPIEHLDDHNPCDPDSRFRDAQLPNYPITDYPVPFSPRGPNRDSRCPSGS